MLKVSLAFLKVNSLNSRYFNVAKNQIEILFWKVGGKIRE